jgi:uncharacterized protein YdaU (DUF1376 family)
MEDLAYRRMLDLYYRTEAPLPASVEEIARLIRMRDYAAFIRDVLNEFFSEAADGWRHARCDAEIARMQDKQAKAKASAQASVNARSANAQRTLNERSAKVELPTPTPTPKEEIPSKLKLAPGFPAEKPSLALVPESSKAKQPDCPHLAVLALWAEVLPSMPSHNPDLWRGARADHLRARWRETASLKGWACEADGIEYLRRLFAYVGKSKFLTGRTQHKGDKPPFVCTLEWLVKPANWAKVLEGNYHPEAA